MRKDQVVYLISSTTTENDMGDSIEVPVSRKVFGSKQSIKQSEFYQAAATGFKPELTLVVWTREYNNEQMLEHNNKKYNIIRTYEPNSEETELICSGLVNKAVE